MPVQPISDFSWYHLRGVDLANALGYVEAGEPTAYWPVGYPAFLGMLYSIFGQSVSVAKLANILLYMGVIFLCYRLTRSLFRSEIVGRISILIIAFYPNHIAYSSLLSCEILCLFLLLPGTFFLVSMDRGVFDFAISGMIFGLACWVKAQTLPLAGVVLVSYYGYSRKKSPGKMLRNLLRVYGVIVLVISPWIARNYLVFGQFVYISNNGGYPDDRE